MTPTPSDTVIITIISSLASIALAYFGYLKSKQESVKAGVLVDTAEINLRSCQKDLQEANARIEELEKDAVIMRTDIINNQRIIMRLESSKENLENQVRELERVVSTLTLLVGQKK